MVQKGSLIAGSWCVFAVVSALPAGAQTAPVSLRRERIAIVHPEAYRTVNSLGMGVGPWRPMSTTPNERNAPNWVAAWDSTGTRLSDFAYFVDPYGPTAGPHTLPPYTYKSFMQANDVALATGTARGIASRVRVGVLWNPNGGGVPSGTLDMVVRIVGTQSVDADPVGMGPAVSGPLSGYEFLRRNQPAGALMLDANLAGQGTGLPLPNGTGGVWVTFGSADAAGNLIPLGGVSAAQAILANLAAPGEPQFPGSNPAGSTEYMWSDEGDATQSSSVNRPDYKFQDLTNNGSAFWAEQFSYDFTMESKGLLQSTVGLFVDTNTPLLQGQVTWGGLSDGAPTPTTATFILRNPANGTERGRFTVALGANGEFRLPDPVVAGGQTRIYLKSGTWLTEAVTATSTGAGQSGLSLVMRNGDIDGDDAVTVFDYDKLSTYFDKTAADADWNLDNGDGERPAQADLDRDGAVTVFDYDVLSQNFDLIGAS